MDLFLARHGDTFNTGEKVVWIGSKDDKPLTQNGIDQAHAVALFFKRHRLHPAQVYSGPLKRATVFADVIAKDLALGTTTQLAPELNEIDYGAWSGLSSDEISEQFGQEVLEAWEKLGTWPKNSGWPGSSDAIMRETDNFAASVVRSAKTPALGITSNGRLRYFWRLCENSSPEKVKTGHLCHLHYAKGKWAIVFWNKQP